MTTPLPNRAHLPTEHRLPASADIDAHTVEQSLAIINNEDAKLPAILREKIPALASLINTITARMSRAGRLIYIGAGTSGRLGVLDASECPPTFHTNPNDVLGIIAGGDTALRKSSEGAEDNPLGSHDALNEINLIANDTLVGIMAGGTTPYVWGALEFAKQKNAATALICCVHLAEAPHVDHLIELVTGPEVVTGSTRMKAGTITKLALNMISTAVMIQRGKTWGNLMVDLRATNAKLRDRAARILTSQTNLDRPAALALLDQAEGRVKTALVMQLRNLSADEANTLLEKNHGQLRPILGPPRA